MSWVVLDDGIANLFELVNPSCNLFEDIAKNNGLSTTGFKLPTFIQALLPLLFYRREQAFENGELLCDVGMINLVLFTQCQDSLIPQTFRCPDNRLAFATEVAGAS